MAIPNLRAAPVTGLPKSCHRCGQNFIDYSDRGCMRTCPACKKPKVNLPRFPPELLGQPLSPRELQIVDLVAAAKLNKEIAFELHLGEGTIKTFVSIILAKTGMPNRTALAVWRVLSAWNASIMPRGKPS
jgi:DNA-binding NarL/FixJ family response regulator